MDQSQFEKMVDSTLQECRNLLITKGMEYAGKEDRLANFKRGAQLTGCTPLQVGMIYLSKHYDALATYVSDAAAKQGRTCTEPVTGRIDDLINYCLLMKALILEDAPNTYASLAKDYEGAVYKPALTQEERSALTDGDPMPRQRACPECLGINGSISACL